MDWFGIKRRQQAAERKRQIIAEMLEKLQYAGIDCTISVLNDSNQSIPAQMVFDPMVSSLFLTTKPFDPPSVGSLIKIDCAEAMFLGEISAHYQEELCSLLVRMEIEHWVPHNNPAPAKTASRYSENKESNTSRTLVHH